LIAQLCPASKKLAAARAFSGRLRSSCAVQLEVCLPESVRYEAVNAMLPNEFLKEDQKVQEQEATVTQLKSTAAMQETTIAQLRSAVTKQEVTTAVQGREIAALTATLKEQASQIQKVSAQLGVSKFATGPHSGRIRPHAKRIRRGGPTLRMVLNNQ
jgi:uncharacterized coiled-coil protein SlyX